MEDKWLCKELWVLHIIRKNNLKIHESEVEIVEILQRQHNMVLSTNKIPELSNKIKQILRQWKAKKGGNPQKVFLSGLENKCFEIDVSQIKTNEPFIRRVNQTTSEIGSDIFSRKRKAYFELSNKQAKRVRLDLGDYFLNVSGNLGSFGLKINELILTKANSNENFNFHIKEKAENLESISIADLLYLKDTWNISDACYTEFAKISNWPSIHYLRLFREKEDKRYSIFIVENGSYTPIKEKVLERIKKDIESDSTDSFLHAKEIKIRISSDGTNFGTKIKCLNIVFTILNEDKICMSPHGTYVIGVFSIDNEDYDTVQECFEKMKLKEQISQLRTARFGNRELPIVYYFGSDLKMMSNCMGIQAANGKNPCPWCKVSKDEFCETKIECSIRDTTKKARSFKEQKEEIDSNKFRFGYSKQRLLDDLLPLENYVVDMLHMHLRISDHLFDQLVSTVSLIDASNGEKIDSNFKITNYPRLGILQEQLKSVCKVNGSFHVQEGTKKIKYAS
jgi:hypothetical protein